MQTNSHHFTSRILSNWQRAHASFRKKVKQWNKGKNVNTCLKHLILCHERIVHGAQSLAQSAANQMLQISTAKNLPEGGGGR